MRSITHRSGAIIFLFVTLFVCPALIRAQSNASIQGQVTDQNGAVVLAATITVRSEAIGIDRKTKTDSGGRYLIAVLPVGNYQIEAQADGFTRQIFEGVRVEVGRSITKNFQLQVGDVSQTVNVAEDSEMIERSTTSVGHVMNQRMVQELPLNGRYFLDLGTITPGSVTPPQNGFSTVPVRGTGSFGINTAGNREETVNYMINGITMNNLWFNSISFQPSVSSVQEFKIDNSTFSAEYGQNSGAVVNIASRSGTNQFHGELFEYFRNSALDARNFFDFNLSEPPPFKRNLFGGSLGGPITKNRTFFFASYEGLRHRQGLNLNSLVLSDAERISVTDPVIAKLIKLIPRANFIDSSGAARFIGLAIAPVNTDHWTIDITHNLTARDRVHGYYAIQRRNFIEPSRQGDTIPGFGDVNDSLRQVLTFTETHIFGPTKVNELRFGFNRISATDRPNAQLNPADFGILNGINGPIGLPQISIAGNGLNFGGPSGLPQSRGDTTFVVADVLSALHGRHSLKFGGEFRQFLNNLSRRPTGAFNFPTVSAFIADTANSFTVTVGDQSSSVAEGALGFFVQDNFNLRTNLTLELGLRYDWNITPTERYDRFIVFDPQSVSLLRVGTDIDEIYHQNNRNFQPRVGFAWDPWKNGKTSVRGAYAILVDQPMTSIATPLSANPPFAIPFTVTGPVRFDNALLLAGPAGIAPQTIDRNFDNPYIQSWNLNVQRELTSTLALMIGYFGSKGTHLIIRRNINQPVNGVRPFPALSISSPTLPGAPLGNITQVESAGNSSYNALWVTANHRFWRGVQFNASYTWSKSLDYNSLSLQGIVVQNSYDLRDDRGLSDFDARHRFVVSTIYDLPFKRNRLVSGWQLALIIQAQTGNTINIVTSDSTFNGVANTLRPDVTGPIQVIGSVDRWFDTTVFVPVAGFGSLGRNVVIGPGFNNTDFSVIKNTQLTETLHLQFRAEIFDLFNHANFGQPGNVVGTPTFGKITNTRFPTGESGSSRQIQFAVKFIF
jgi:hypothetical protein